VVGLNDIRKHLVRERKNGMGILDNHQNQNIIGLSRRVDVVGVVEMYLKERMI
jgi:hypothetical protein